MGEKGGENYKDIDRKYKMFRNFMVNELGISRHDIAAWTKQAVVEDVQKAVNAMDIEGMVERAVRKSAAQYVTGNSSGHTSLRQDIVREIVNKLEVKMK